MKRIEARIKTPFGEVVIEGENPQEILDLLGIIPENFVEKLSDFVSDKLTPSGAQLKGIIEPTTEGQSLLRAKALRIMRQWVWCFMLQGTARVRRRRFRGFWSPAG